MSQHDYNIANQTFPATRTDLNNALGAVATNNSGNSQPATTYANQWWFDLDDNKLYMRNKDNDAWVSILTIGATSDLQTITTDLISEVTSAAGVTIDGLLIKDSAVGATGTATSVAGIPFYSDSSNNSMYTHDVSGTDSTAENNTAYGFAAMDAITTGDKNVAVGKGSLGALTSGEHNIGIGFNAADGFDTETRNIAIGSNALGGGSLSGGEENVAIGYASLDALTSGDANVAIGDSAGSAITTGGSNVFIGNDAGLLNTSAGGVIFIGTRAGDGHDTETNNLGIGKDSLGGAIAGGEYNVAIGNLSLDALTSADKNTAIGYEAASAVTTGSNNTVVGQSAAFHLTTGIGNTIVGRLAAENLDSGSNNTLIGRDAGASYVGSGSNCTIVGFGSRPHSSADNEDNTTVLGSGITSGQGNEVHIGNTSVTAIKGQVSFSTYSDERIKRDIVDGDLGLDFVNKLKPRKFKRRNPAEYADIFDDGNKEPIKEKEKDNVFDGLIAQEVEAVCNELGVSFSGHEVSTSQGNKQSIQYETLTMPLIKAVQELSAQVTTLQQEINTLKGE